MNFSRSNPKNDAKLNSGHAAPPATGDQSKGPAQANQKGNDAKPTVQAPGTPDISKHDGQDGKAGVQPSVKASSEGKADGESVVSEGGHVSPGKTPDAVREPDASVIAQNEPSKGSADGAADKPGLSANPAS
jgi:hypothetical protein